MLSELTKSIIEKKLGLSFDQIIQKSSEQLDDHISNNIVHKKLEITESKADIISRRGCVLDLISMSAIDEEIDNFVRAK